MTSENRITVLEGRKRYDASNRDTERSLENKSSGRKLPVTTTTQRVSAVSQEKNLKSIETLYRSEGGSSTSRIVDKRIGTVATRRSH